PVKSRNRARALHLLSPISVRVTLPHVPSSRRGLGISTVFTDVFKVHRMLDYSVLFSHFGVRSSIPSREDFGGLIEQPHVAGTLDATGGCGSGDIERFSSCRDHRTPIAIPLHKSCHGSRLIDCVVTKHLTAGPRHPSAEFRRIFPKVADT